MYAEAKCHAIIRGGTVRQPYGTVDVVKICDAFKTLLQLDNQHPHALNDHAAAAALTAQITRSLTRAFLPVLFSSNRGDYFSLRLSLRKLLRKPMGERRKAAPAD